MNTRILVAVVGVPVLILIIWLGPNAMLAALCVLSGVAGWELQNCVSRRPDTRNPGGKNKNIKNNNKNNLNTKNTVRILRAYSAVWSALAVPAWYAGTEYAVIVSLAGVLLIFTWAILQEGAVKFDQIMAALFSGILISWSFASFLRMDNLGLPREWLLLPFVLSFSCDIFAYLAGRAFGKHKLTPYVSPHKTIEGAVGGLIGNLLCGVIFFAILNQFVYTPFHGLEPRYIFMAVFSLLCGVAAQIGDLSFSLIKRQYGIKDYGRLFLDHGGVLDRFDSVLFVAPIVEIILKIL